MRYTIAATLVALGISACAADTAFTTVTATVADHAYEGDGLAAGSPLAGAALRLYRADTIVLEATLDETGTAVIEPEPGVYSVQVELPATGDCFWGETMFDVTLPTDRLELAAFYICPGGA